MSFKKSIEDLCRLFNLTPNTIKKIIKREREKRNIIIPDIYYNAMKYANTFDEKLMYSYIKEKGNKNVK